MTTENEYERRATMPLSCRQLDLAAEKLLAIGTLTDVDSEPPGLENGSELRAEEGQRRHG